jgi:hypothetical protein
MADDSGERGFKVVDRRSFDSEGREREASEQDPETSETSETSEAADRTCAEPQGFAADPALEVDFVTFILSLHSSAACLLGHAPYPDTGKCAVNLPMAKQTVDIIGMLQDKTKGNLTGEEERILSEILYDLRMAYVQAVKK